MATIDDRERAQDIPRGRLQDNDHSGSGDAPVCHPGGGGNVIGRGHGTECKGDNGGVLLAPCHKAVPWLALLPRR